MSSVDLFEPAAPPPARQYVTYFDEVKAMPKNGQNFYLVGGIAVPMDEIGRVEAAVTTLAEQVFQTRELVPKAEFHASHIYFAKGSFKGKSLLDRVKTLAQLADIIVNNDLVKHIYAAVDTTKLKLPEKAPEFAFAHFCERVQLMMGHKSTSILIGDLDDQQARIMVRDFARFRASGTPWVYGVEVKNVVDSVHFTRSHHSRMMQLADVYMFIVSGGYGSRKGPMADLLRDALKGKDLHPHRYKDWPKG